MIEQQTATCSEEHIAWETQKMAGVNHRECSTHLDWQRKKPTVCSIMYSLWPVRSTVHNNRFMTHLAIGRRDCIDACYQTGISTYFIIYLICTDYDKDEAYTSCAQTQAKLSEKQNCTRNTATDVKIHAFRVLNYDSSCQPQATVSVQ